MTLHVKQEQVFAASHNVNFGFVCQNVEAKVICLCQNLPSRQSNDEHYD